MSPRRSAALAALCGTVVLAGWVAAGLAGFGSHGIENTGGPIEDSRAASVTAEPVDTPKATAMGENGVSVADVAIVDAGLPDPRPMLPPETPPAKLAVASTLDPVQNYAKEAVSSVETLDECLVAEICIDQYLWSVYQRTPKVDTIKVPERIKVTAKKKGKTRTVIKTVTKLVDEDFTWKDPNAAEKAGMSLMDYVIGGMDRSFKLKLYHTLRALDDAGLSPGITSGFRGDYRQSIASGKKAASDSSYHGGSRRGGYGHGLAADVVSVKGETRSERCSSSENLWKWIDAHGKEFGIGRPYLDKDPPHVAPIDGQEYANHRSRTNAQHAGLETNRRHRLETAARDSENISSSFNHLATGGRPRSLSYTKRLGQTPNPSRSIFDPSPWRAAAACKLTHYAPAAHSSFLGHKWRKGALRRFRRRGAMPSASGTIARAQHTKKRPPIAAAPPHLHSRRSGARRSLHQ
jgi:hypothetical protein